MMGEMKQALDEVNEALKGFSRKTPDQVRSFRNLLRAVEKEGALSMREKELISVALSVIQHCKWCISLHVKNALKVGATEDEILEAAWTAVMMGGGPALMHARFVLEAVNEFRE